MNKNLLSSIPSVNDILENDLADKIKDQFSRTDLLDGIRKITDDLRNEILSEDFDGKNFDKNLLNSRNILLNAEKYLKKLYQPKMAPAINATGVIIHTNLGRSLLAEKAREAVDNVAKHYSTLEIDRESGERGHRYASLQKIIKKLTGAEAALVVNNNAAAVTLVLAALAEGREVIISRGELVEIGGSFRIPEVMERSGCQLVEVGSTNKIYLKDYLNAVSEETGALLKVHTSNYRIMGFTETVKAEELVEHAHKRDVPVIEDLGSGILFDLQDYGLEYEPTVAESISAGIDIVTFSGDKLLGGPQAGIIVGKKKFIEKIEYHPLMRALRVDKFTLAALEATLNIYRNFDKAVKTIPTLRMLTEDIEKTKQRADNLLNKIKVVDKFNFIIEKGTARIGGGAYPLTELDTYVLKISSKEFSPEKIAYLLRQSKMPVFTRINEGQLIFDLKTVQPFEIDILADTINDVLQEEIK